MKNIKFLLVLALGVFTMVSCKSNTEAPATSEATEAPADSVTVPTEEATVTPDSVTVPVEGTEAAPADSTHM